jgi:hypothetical protein
VRLLPLALLLGTSSALAFDTSKLGQWGSLFLDDLAPIIVKSARLQQEINEVLSQNSKKEEEVTCFGMRFPGQWKNLGGLRVSPYTCDFGAMWLQIHATVRVTDRRGQVFQTITDKAMNNATNVSETNLKWKWTTERPVLNFKILSWMLSAIDCTGVHESARLGLGVKGSPTCPFRSTSSKRSRREPDLAQTGTAAWSPCNLRSREIFIPS